MKFRGSDDLGPTSHVEERVFPDGTRVELRVAGCAGVPAAHSVLITLPDGRRLGPAAVPAMNVLWYPILWRVDLDHDGEDEYLYESNGVGNGSMLLERQPPNLTILDPRGEGPDRPLMVLGTRRAEVEDVVAEFRLRTESGRERSARNAVDLSPIFAAEEATGSIIILPASADPLAGTWEHDPAANDRRSSPASSSKIAHAILALKSGAISGLDERFEWDGITRRWPDWNQDLTVAEAIRCSAVWVFEAIAERITVADYRAALTAYGLGSARAHADGLFWLDGSLTVSPREQVLMLRRLHGRDRDVSIRSPRPNHLGLIASALPVERGDGWAFRFKTGWARAAENDARGDQGWCIGWVERAGQEPVYVATRIALAEASDGPKRQAVTLACLRAVGVLPPE